MDAAFFPRVAVWKLPGRRWIVAALVVLLGGGAIVLSYFVVVWVVKRSYAECRAVDPGVLYRAGRLDHALIEQAVRKHGIKTLVDLRNEETAPHKGETEPEWARRQGLRYFNLRMGAKSAEELTANFLAIVTTPAFRPVLVHCHHGRVRTNLCIAMYRITQQGWSADQAFEEMVATGLFPSEHERWRSFLRKNENYDWKRYVTLNLGEPDGAAEAGPKLKIRR